MGVFRAIAGAVRHMYAPGMLTVDHRLPCLHCGADHDEHEEHWS